MASPALMFSYFFLVLFVVIILVLLCLGCSCHVPLGKCVRCFCENTTDCCAKCCPRRNKQDDKFKSVLDEPRRGSDAKQSARKASATADQAGCLHWVPLVLTCGYCCGTFKDENEYEKMAAPAGGMVVAQPLAEESERGEVADEEVGTEYAIASSIPLLSIPS